MAPFASLLATPMTLGPVFQPFSPFFLNVTVLNIWNCVCWNLSSSNSDTTLTCLDWVNID